MILPGFGVAAAVALIGSGPQGASVVTRASAAALGLAAMVVLTGWSGQLNLHVAAVGIGWGAYASAALSAFGAPAAVALVAAPVVACAPAALLGAAAIRFRGLELAIATLAAGFVCEQGIFPSLGRALARGGSETSLALVHRPGFAAGDAAFAVLALSLACGALAATWWWGARVAPTMSAVRDAEVVAEARGVPAAAWRLGAFVASVALAALAGSIGAAQSGVVTPDGFGLTLSLQIFAVAVLTGVDRLERVVLGAALLTLATEAASIPGLHLISGDRADLVFGAGLLLVLAQRARKARTSATARATAPASGTAGPRAGVATGAHAVTHLPASPDGASALRVEDVTVRLGGRAIVEGLSLRVGRSEVVGLIGGNGAGKTTTLNVLTGLVAPDSGSVFLDGLDVTQASPHRRARLGLGRTFQGGGLTPGSVIDAVAASLPSRARAETALREAGLDHLASTEVARLAPGDARLVEIAAAAARSPVALLLDEPLAGLDEDERGSVLAAISRARASGIGVLVIEHDHASLARVADRIVVLRSGRIEHAQEVVSHAAHA